MKKDILLKKIIENLSKDKSSNFLDKSEIKFITHKLNSLKIKYKIYLSFEEAERAIIYKETLPDISLIKINTKNEITHSDILGFLYNFQIDMSLIGDIIVSDSNLIICKKEISDYLLYNIDKIKKNNVTCELVKLDYLNNYKRQYESIKLLVPSFRIDVVIAKITKKSRSNALEIIKNNYVILNYEELKKVVNLKLNDVFSIRRYGKYIFKKIEGKTKNNIIIVLDKYI